MKPSDTHQLLEKTIESTTASHGITPAEPVALDGDMLTPGDYEDDMPLDYLYLTSRKKLEKLLTDAYPRLSELRQAVCAQVFAEQSATDEQLAHALRGMLDSPDDKRRVGTVRKAAERAAIDLAQYFRNAPVTDELHYRISLVREHPGGPWCYLYSSDYLLGTTGRDAIPLIPGTASRAYEVEEQRQQDDFRRRNNTTDIEQLQNLVGATRAVRMPLPGEWSIQTYAEVVQKVLAKTSGVSLSVRDVRLYAQGTHFVVQSQDTDPARSIAIMFKFGQLYYGWGHQSDSAELERTHNLFVDVVNELGSPLQPLESEYFFKFERAGPHSERLVEFFNGLSNLPQRDDLGILEFPLHGRHRLARLLLDHNVLEDRRWGGRRTVEAYARVEIYDRELPQAMTGRTLQDHIKWANAAVEERFMDPFIRPIGHSLTRD